MSVMCQVHRIERIMLRDEHTPDAAETTLSNIKLELWVTSLSDTPRLQYYDVQTFLLVH
jgi:hypothetical protein